MTRNWVRSGDESLGAMAKWSVFPYLAMKERKWMEQQKKGGAFLTVKGALGERKKPAEKEGGGCWAWNRVLSYREEMEVRDSGEEIDSELGGEWKPDKAMRAIRVSEDPRRHWEGGKIMEGKRSEGDTWRVTVRTGTEGMPSGLVAEAMRLVTSESRFVVQTGVPCRQHLHLAWWQRLWPPMTHLGWLEHPQWPVEEQRPPASRGGTAGAGGWELLGTHPGEPSQGKTGQSQAGPGDAGARPEVLKRDILPLLLLRPFSTGSPQLHLPLPHLWAPYEGQHLLLWLPGKRRKPGNLGLCLVWKLQSLNVMTFQQRRLGAGKNISEI